MFEIFNRVINYLQETIGYIKIDQSGNKKVADRDFKVVGYYDKTHNITTDAYGRVYSLGDGSHRLIKF